MCRYEKCNTNSERAALILAAPDVLYSKRGAAGKEVTRIVIEWIEAIVQVHPLCVKQRQGLPIMSFGYRDRAYRTGAWTELELQALRQRQGDTVECLKQAVPSRNVRSIKKKVKELQPGNDGAEKTGKERAGHSAPAVSPSRVRPAKFHQNQGRSRTPPPTFTHTAMVPGPHLLSYGNCNSNGNSNSNRVTVTVTVIVMVIVMVIAIV